MLEAEKQFRKVIGETDLPRLAIAIERRLTSTSPTQPRRTRSQSLCNDHTRTVVTKFHGDRATSLDDVRSDGVATTVPLTGVGIDGNLHETSPRIRTSLWYPICRCEAY